MLLNQMLLRQKQKQKEEREGGAAQQQQFRLEQTVFKIMAKDVKVTPCDPGIQGIELDTKQKQKNPVPKEIFVPPKILFG